MAATNLTNYRLTPAAHNDLEDIWHYTVQQWSIEQANLYIDLLEDTFQCLVSMPEIAHERTEFHPPVRIHPNSKHLIVYRIEADYLSILRVLGSRQDWQTILRTIDQ